MRVAVFGTKPYDRRMLEERNAEFGHDLTYFEPRLNVETAVLAKGFPTICVFVNDTLDRSALTQVAAGGTRLIALRCAGFNNVDLDAAAELGLRVVRVPAYSPASTAEFTVALMLSLARHVHRAYARVRENNFSLEGLLGAEMKGKTVGVVGTGKIGAIVARIMRTGFQCDVIASDVEPNPDLVAIGVRYVSRLDIAEMADIITLHCPLNPDTRHLVDAAFVGAMKPGALMVNTSRGALIDTGAVIDGLKAGTIGGLALDVYEQEEDLFFEDLSNEVITDDVFQRLLTFPNVLVTGHQAFFTREALANIAETTLANIRDFEDGRELKNEVAKPHR